MSPSYPTLSRGGHEDSVVLADDHQRREPFARQGFLLAGGISWGAQTLRGEMLFPRLLSSASQSTIVEA